MSSQTASPENPRFLERVLEARAMLRSGYMKSEVRELHGKCVLDRALDEIADRQTPAEPRERW